MSSLTADTFSIRRPVPLLAALGVLVAFALALAAAPQLALRGALGLLVVGGLAGLALLVWHMETSWSLTIGFVLAIFAGFWEEFGIPGAFSPQRWMLIGAIAAVLLHGARELGRPALRVNFTHALMALALSYAAVSALASGQLVDRAALFELFDSFGVLPFLVFLVAPLAFRNEKRRNVLLVGLVGLGGYLGVTAVLETVGLRSLVFPRYINDPSVGIHFDRARGPFVEAATNGLAMYTCAIAAAIALTKWRTRGARWLALAVLSLAVAGIVMTLTRQAWVATVVATLVTFAVVPALRRYLVPLAAIAALLVAGIFIVLPSVLTRVEERAANQRTVWERKNNNRTGVNMLLERPLVGFGWNSYLDHKSDYFQQADTYPPAGTEPYIAIHNLPILYGAELGLIGLTLFVAALLGAVGGGLLRRGPPELDPWKAGLLAQAIAYVIVALFVAPGLFSSLSTWLFAGVAASGVYQRDESMP